MSDRLTAMDIQNEQFRRKVRGYDPEDVDLFLKSVAEEVERLNLENGELREELGKVKAKVEDHRSNEKVLKETLVSAQKMAEETKDRARQESDLVLQHARLEADKLLAEARDNLNRLETDIDRGVAERESFEHGLRSLIDQHLNLLDMRRQSRVEPGNLRVYKPRPSTEVG
jgi:cell division initiation protein